jgi:hypothetical protein
LKDREAALVIRRIRAERDGAVYRVAADVGGDRLWFATRDVEPAPAPEAFGCAALIPAAAAGRPLRIEAPLDPLWRANAAAVLERFREHPSAAHPFIRLGAGVRARRVA